MKNKYTNLRKYSPVFASKQIMACVGMVVFSLLISATVFAQVSGVVYHDYNSDGLQGTAENGVTGIAVSAVDQNGNTATATTNALGAYTLSFGNCTGAVRVRFDLNAYNAQTTSTDDNLYCTTIGTGSSVASVAFVNCGATGVNLGVNAPADYCELNPKVVVPCYVNGDPLANCSGLSNPAACAGDGDVLVGFDYNSFGDATSDELDHLASGREVGAVWGLSYQRASKQLFASSVVRSHVGLGSQGTGGIYKVDASSGTSNPIITNYLNLNIVCGSSINTGANPHQNLTASKTAPAHDDGGILNTGKVGLGGLALSTNEQFLYTVNLNQKTLHKIAIGSPAKANISCSDITTFPIPSACSNASESRPWAVSTWKGKVYVGTVCSGEMGGAVTATIYEFAEPASWTPVLTWTIDTSDNSKGCTNGSFGCEWNAWASTYPQTFGTSIIYPQPILADIEFDADGSMVIGMMDRSGLQGGYRNYFYPAPDQELYSAFSGGDILRAQRNGATWVLESNATFAGVANAPTGCGAGNGQGIGGGEFYCGDDWEGNNHLETSLGGLAMLLGTGEVMSSAFDPTSTINSGGVQKYSNLNGSNQLIGVKANTDDYAVYSNAESGTFGKATGIGDVELLCGVAPLEIGNFVWIDANTNGVQDPGEIGVANVAVSLYTSTGTLLGTTTTNANGNYYFNNTNITAGIQPNTTYIVQIDNTNFTGVGNLLGLQLTTANATADDLDADGTQAGGSVTASITTANYGENNHTIDFGFVSQVDLSLQKTANVSLVNLGDMVTYTITITNEGGITATGIQVSETFPAGLIIESTNNSQGDFGANNVWNVGTLAAGASATLTIQAEVNTVGDIINTAEIIAQNQVDVDSTPNNQVGSEDDIDTVVIKSQQADVTLTKTSNAVNGIKVGDTFTYTISVTNQGASTATGVSVVDVLPAQVQYIMASPNTYNVATGVWTVGTLLAGQTTSVAIEVSVTQAGTITNTAQVSQMNETDVDSTPNNNIASEDDQDSVTVQAIAAFNCSAFVVTSAQANPVICADTNSGSLLITTSGGTAPYVYTLDNTAPATADGNSVALNGLSVGAHVITFTDANGCIASYNFTIAQTANPTLNVVDNIPANCGANNGSLNVLANGAGTMSISLNNQTPQTGTNGIFNFTNLAGGTYSINITDANGCEASTTVTVSQSQAPTITLNSSSPALCGNPNGTLGFSIVGSGSMTIALNTGQSFSGFSGTYEFKNIPAGNYTATVADANGCTSSLQASVVATTPPSVSVGNTTLSDCGSSNGTLSAIVAGNGVLIITLNGAQAQSGSSGTYTYNNLAEGAYTVMVTDTNGCTSSANAIISEKQAPSISLGTTTLAACGASNGTMSVTVNGEGTLTVTLNNGQTQSGVSGMFEFTNLSAGTYTATVTASAGCSASINGTVNQTLAPTITLANATNATCGNPNGAASVITTGNATMDITLNGVTQSGLAGTYNFTGLAAGSYTATVTDANNCTSTTKISISDSTAPTISLGNTTPDNCDSGEGSIGFTVTGINPLQVALSDGQTLNVTAGTYQFTGLTAGTYTLSVTDQNLCAASVTATVGQTSGPAISMLDIDLAACGNATGAVIVDASGDGDLFISLNNTQTQNGTSGSYTFSGLAAGNYTATVTDGNSCTASVSVVIGESTAPAISIASTNPAACGNANGSINVIVSGTGTMNITVNQQTQSGVAGTYTFTGLTAGNYTATVANADACTASASTVVGTSQNPTIAVANTTPIACIGSSGAMSVNVNGSGNLIITLSDGQLESGNSGTYTFTGLLPQTYTATVTDSNGCTSNTTATISQNNGPSITVNNTIAEACNNGEGSLIVAISGVGNMTISLSDGQSLSGNSGTYQFSNLSAGTYDILVEDVNSCLEFASATVEAINEPFNISVANVSNAGCNGLDNGQVELIIDASTTNYTVSWTGPTTGSQNNNDVIAGLAAGVYTITVTNNLNSCFATTQVPVSNLQSINYVASPIAASCDGENGGITVSISTSDGSAMTVDFGQGTEVVVNNAQNQFIPLPAATYNVSFTDINGCVLYETITVPSEENSSLDYSVNTSNSEGCDSANGTMTLSVTGGTGDYSITYNGNTTPGLAISGLAQGNYSAILTDGDCGTYNFNFTIGENCTIVNPTPNQAPCAYTEQLCTENQTPLEYCVIDDCDPDGDNVIITEVHSLYDCSLTILTTTCFRYLPLPGFINQVDEVTVTVCDDANISLCSVITLEIQVGGCSQGTDVTGTDTATTDDSNTDVTGTDVTGTDTATTDDSNTDVTGTDVTGTDTATTDDSNTDITGTDVTGTDTATTDDSNTDITGTDVTGTDTATTDDSNTDITGTDVTGTDTTGTDTSTDDSGTSNNGSISGTVWSDFNENGMLDSNEIGVFDVLVVLTYPNGSTQTTVTDLFGAYSFEDLPAGEYIVAVFAPNGFNLTTPTTYTLSLSANQSINNNNFGLHQPAAVSQPCQDTLYYCLAPMTELVVCAPNCAVPGANIQITETVSTYGCSIYELNDTCVRYLPLPGFLGNDYVIMTVCDDSTPVDCYVVVLDIFVSTQGCESPIAANDQACVSNGVATINPLENDFHPSGLNIVLTEVGNANFGITTLNANGTITYQAGSGFTIGDSFSYTVCDEQGLCDVALVVITPCDIVEPTCEANAGTLSAPSPAITADGQTIAPTVSGQQTANGFIYVYVLTTDAVANDGIGFDIVDVNTTGVFNLNDYNFETFNIHGLSFEGTIQELLAIGANAGEQVLAAIEAQAICADLIVPGYTVSTATTDCVSSTEICAEPTVLIEFCPEFCDVSDITEIVNTITTFNCSVNITEENPLCVQYIALPGYVGLDSLFIVGQNAAGMMDTALYFINVGSCFAPEALNDQYAFDSGETSYNFSPLDNDSDPCDRPIVPQILLQPTEGTVSINADNSFTFVPNDPNFVGTVNFTYQVCNNCRTPLCDDAIVSITFEGDDLPNVEANPDIVTTVIDVPVTFNVLNNDSGTGILVTDITQPSSGNLDYNGNGEFTYTPEPGFTGTVYFEYTVCDENNNCESTVVSITVFDGPNQAPTSNNDQATTTNNQSVIIDVLANDFDPENGDLVISNVIQPDSCGTVINNGINLEFIPDETCGDQEVTFAYIVCDVEGACDTATVVVAVGLPLSNTAPQANDDQAEVAIGGTTSIDVLANDTDADGDDLGLPIIGAQPENGTATVDPVTGEIIYTPNENFAGIDNLIYIICDNGNPPLCDTAAVVIQVGVAGDGPIANEDLLSTASNNSVTANVIANDEGTNITITQVTQPQNGTVVINPDGTITYTPNQGFAGDDYFTYTICDAFGLCDTTVVGVQVFDTNQQPVGGNDVYVLENCDPIELDVLANDVDPENGNLTIVGFSSPDPCGTVELIEATQTLLYSPICEGQCTDNPLSFIYIVCDDPGIFSSCDTVDVVVTFSPLPINNIAPTAINDEYTTPVDTSIDFNVLDNDFDVNQDDTLTVNSITEPLNGTLTFDEDGNVSYTPNTGFEGIDNFFYIVCDNGFPVLCDTAYVAIQVGEIGEAPVANPDFIMTPINTVVEINVIGNDEGENISITGNTEPENGSVLYDEATGNFIYFPNPDFVGTDSFTYTICNQNNQCDESFVVIEVFQGPNMPPVGNNDVATIDLGETAILDVLANDGDPENGDLTLTEVLLEDDCLTATIVNNQLELTASNDPACDETTVEFDYVVCDAQLNCDTATVIVSIGIPVSNHPPTGVNEEYSIAPGESIDFNVLDDDFDIDGDSIGVSSMTNPANGTITWDADGNITYVPNAGFTGNDYLAYILCDDGMPILCDTAFVDIFVDPSLLGAGPDLTPDVVITPLDTPIEIDVLANDNGIGLTVTEHTEPQNGSLIFDATTGTFTYFPNSGFCEEDFFFYTACDVNNQCDSTLVSIDVLCEDENIPPTATDDLAELAADDTTICLDVLANDYDINGDTLIITNVTSPGLGIALFTLNENGEPEICYTVNQGVTDTIDVFEYIVCDGFLPAGQCDTAQVVIVIGNAEITNLPPVAANDEATTNGGNPVSICVGDNDTDPNEGDVLTVGLLNNPANGTVALDENGCIVYTPDEGFTGEDYFPYVICDNGIPNLCDTAYVSVNVVESDINAQDDYATTFGGQSVTVDITDNDTPQDGITDITIVTNPANGTAIIDADGNLIYTPNPDFTGTDTLVYQICVNELCDQATVFIEVSGCELVIKNGISPNGDGINDVFDIPGLEDCYGQNDPELIIFNRWGNEIVRIKGYDGSIAGAWDGTYKGNDVPDGTYFYVILLNTGNNDDNLNGFIEVFR